MLLVLLCQLVDGLDARAKGGAAGRSASLGGGAKELLKEGNFDISRYQPYVYKWRDASRTSALGQGHAQRENMETTAGLSRDDWMVPSERHDQLDRLQGVVKQRDWPVLSDQCEQLEEKPSRSLAQSPPCPPRPPRTVHPPSALATPARPSLASSVPRLHTNLHILFVSLCPPALIQFKCGRPDRTPAAGWPAAGGEGSGDLSLSLYMASPCGSTKPGPPPQLR
ncbi:hypothetical protein DMC30DRAFT_126684 [Rhodotorula diobovata]|uniref:Uncharacterized protein n=1 Tax=Rhodotorula diobovata TaxID=5288 RepID=A0A5C5FM36_9BASI|nr:hypothetical protein DMC30DRAFT_126684 [Rhodotorula diobovata]